MMTKVPVIKAEILQKKKEKRRKKRKKMRNPLEVEDLKMKINQKLQKNL